MSALVYQGRNRRHLQSTLVILRGIMEWPEFQPTPPEVNALIRYHLRLCFLLQLPEEALEFYLLLESPGPLDRLLKEMADHFPGITELYVLFRQARQEWKEIF
jgi:hypothetical protein